MVSLSPSPSATTMAGRASASPPSRVQTWQVSQNAAAVPVEAVEGEDAETMKRAQASQLMPRHCIKEKQREIKVICWIFVALKTTETLLCAQHIRFGRFLRLPFSPLLHACLSSMSIPETRDRTNFAASYMLI